MIGLLAAAASTVIPANFRGTWQEARYACNAGVLHTRVHIGARTLSDGEFDARLDKILVLSRNHIQVLATWLGADDENDPVTFDWRLQRGKLLERVSSRHQTSPVHGRVTVSIRCGDTM